MLKFVFYNYEDNMRTVRISRQLNAIRLPQWNNLMLLLYTKIFWKIILRNSFVIKSINCWRYSRRKCITFVHNGLTDLGKTYVFFSYFIHFCYFYKNLNIEQCNYSYYYFSEWQNHYFVIITFLFLMGTF